MTVISEHVCKSILSYEKHFLVDHATDVKQYVHYIIKANVLTSLMHS